MQPFGCDDNKETRKSPINTWPSPPRLTRRKENICIKRVRLGVATGGRQSARMYRTAISLLKNFFCQPPEDEEGCRGDQKSAKSKAPLFICSGLPISLDLERAGMLPVLSRLVRPQLECCDKRRLPKYGTPLKAASWPSSGVFVKRLRPYRLSPLKILGYRSFRRPERETAAYRPLMRLPTTGRGCW